MNGQATRHKRPAHSPDLRSFSELRQFFEECFASVDPTRETLWVTHVDEDGKYLHLARYDGDEKSAPCPPDEILADIFQHGTLGLFLAHNHPAGRRDPTMQDLRMTQLLATHLEPAHCVVRDHLIFAGDHCFSFWQAGLTWWLDP